MKGIRLIAVLAAVLLALGATSIALAEQGEPSETDPALSEAPVSEPGPEVAADRTANSQTFRLPDGGLERRFYADPINYREEGEGEWKPIGNALRESPDGASLTNGQNDFDVTLPKQIDADPARISFGEDWIASRLLSDSTEAVQLEGETASYESPQGGLALVYSGLANGLKEDIELANSSQPNTFTFELEASPGLSPELTEEGAVVFHDAEGNLIATLPAPVMSDSAAERPIESHAIHYALKSGGEDSWRLSVEADREWLDSPERAWPVHLDPSVLKIEMNPGGTFDCAFGGKKGSTSEATCGTKGIKTLTAASWPKANAAEDEWSRVLLHFDLKKEPKLPAGAYVSAATLGMRASEAALNTSGVELGLVKQKIESSGLSWVNYSTGHPWTQEGGDYSEIVGKVTTAERGTAPGWWQFPLNVRPIMEYAREGEKPERIDLLAKLIDDKVRECGTSCTQRAVKFESSAASLAENRPYLALTYYAAAPKTSKLVSPTDGTVSARRFKLKAKWESGVTGVTFQYRKGTKGLFQTIPAEFVKNAEGKAVSWPVAVGGGGEESPPVYLDATALEPKFKAEEGKLQIRALFDGGAGFDGYSTPNSVTVNPEIGGPGDTTAEVGPGSVDLLTGNYTVTRSDFNLPGSISGIDVSRTYSSRESGPSGDTTVLGRGWKPTSLVESAGGADWRSVREVPPTAEEAEWGLSGYAVLTNLDGSEISFEKEGSSYISPPEMDTSTLAKGENTFTLSDFKGNKTVFSNNGSGTEYLPISVTQTGSGDTSAKYVYELVNGRRRLKTLVAAGGVKACSETSKLQPGCHVLEFAYQSATTWGAPAADGDRLSSITYWGPEAEKTQGHWEVAKYKYDSAGRLIEEWDPLLASPLKETYAYAAELPSESAGLLKTLTPAGQEPWTFEYKSLPGEKAEAGRLRAVKRASLLASPTTAQTTIAYEVPLSGGSSAPHMTLGEISKWGQEDVPVGATAIFPPTEVPATPPSSYAQASIYYMDPTGETTNFVNPAPSGASGPSISTTETDEFGNVIRELSPQNRLRALEAGAGSVTKSHELESKYKYSKDGTQLQEEWGPLHPVSIEETGPTEAARMHTIYHYENGFVTLETTGASVVGKGIDADQRIVETKYDWTLLMPTETIVDPNGLKLKTVTVYEPVTGLVKERRSPAGPTGGDAHSTKIVYYDEVGAPTICKKDGFAGLPCEIGPAAQPGTAGLPEMLVTKYKSYNSLGEPTEVVESPGGKEEAGKTRKTLVTYDAIGRETSKAIIGGGKELPPVKTIYNATTGFQVEQKFTCETSCEGFKSQASVAEYDKLGRPVKYTDADGNTSTGTYDLDGRVATTANSKGSQKYGYDSTSGLLTTLEDSSAGAFTAAYNADGAMTEEGLPDGIVAKTSYDETGQPIALAYMKESSTWFEEKEQDSIYGQVLSDENNQGLRQYSYDKAGRLTWAKETPQGGNCTTRQYLYEGEAGKDSNRTKMTTRPSASGVCDTSSEGTSQSYKYDAADRLEGELTYDPFGRIIKLPGKYGRWRNPGNDLLF